ncbi:LPD38 domain-containing protein [Shewanella algae]|uniref:LPD38 domain-containing protein n=1 Tax=Shewanella algae TaxID=38313 RepID=UPI00313CBF65
MSLLNFDPNQYRTQSPTQQSQTSQQQGRFADSVDMFQAGAASGLGGIFDFFGADGIAKSLYGISDDQFGQLSDRGREAMSKPMFEFNELGEVALGEGMTDLDSWILNMANMAGQLAPTMIPGAGMAGAATKALSLGAKGAKAAQVAGMGLTGGSSATGQAMNQARQEVMNIPDQVLADSDIFQRKFIELDQQSPELDDLAKWNAAKSEVAEQVAKEVRADPKTLLANFAASAIGDPILGKALTGIRLAKSGAFRSALAGAFTEGATEAAQAGTSQYAVDSAVSKLDNRDPTANVKLAALNEGVLGAGVGGVAGFGGGLLNRKPKPEVKNDAADPIREDSPGLASAMDTLAGESVARQIDMAEIAATQTPASPAIDYDQPAAARQAGMGGTMDAGRFGDEVIARDNAMKGRSFPTVPGSDFQRSRLSDAIEQAQSLADNRREGEWLPPETQARPITGLLVNPSIDSETLNAQRAREAMASQPTNLIGKSSTIFAYDGRPSQQRRESIEQQRRKVERESAARPLAIEDKGIVFSGNQSGVNVMSSGRPFKTAKEALASKGARIAKREGATVQAVKFGDGWGWEDSRQSQPQQTEQIQQAPDLTPQALPKASDMTVDQLDKEWVAFKPETGTLNIPRAKMPQIKAEHRGAMVNFMNARGVEHVSEEVPADSLKPTQAEFSPAKVKKALGYDGGDRSILISSDNYVLDGHHQWLTKQEKGEPIKVIRLKAPIGELVDLAHEFPSSQTEAQQAAEQDADQAATKEEAVSPEPVTATPAAPEATAQPAQLELPVTEPIQSKAPADSDTPVILRTTKAKWRQSELKRLGIKKGSPGYAEALAKVDDNYEAEIDKALAQSPFEVYQEFNSDTPESINRRAYEELRKEFAVDDAAPSKDEAAKAQGESEKAEPITDFGEKIGGAKKDTWQATIKALEDTGTTESQPLSKSWPEPDYQKLIGEGVTPEAAALAAMLRGVTGTKPRDKRRLAGWTASVNKLKEIALSAISGEKTADQAIDSMINERLISSRVNAYEIRRTLPVIAKSSPANFKRAARYMIGGGNFSMFNGVQFDKPKTMHLVEFDGKSIYSTADESLEVVQGRLAELLAADAKSSGTAGDTKKYSKVSVYVDRHTKESFLGWESSTGVLRIKTFPGTKEARAYLEANRDEVEQRLQQMKKIPSERRAENRSRVGPKRYSANVTPAVFAETFGFRGVEFGNWVEQGKRQKDLNEAYDALADLADAIDIPLKALSLNGRLGMAFGARGSGGVNPAKAHYEPGKLVINLTKKAGAGSLAHEWMHALDNYFNRDRRGGDFISDNAYGQHNDPVREPVVNAFKGLMKAIGKDSGMLKRALGLDSTRSKAYWSENTEMLARSFERFIIDELGRKGMSNDYLANIIDEAEWNKVQGALAEVGLEAKPYPYPTNEEAAGINAAFQTLFETIDSRPTEGGNIELFSKNSRGVNRGSRKFSQADAQRAVDDVMKRLSGAAGIRVNLFTSQEEFLERFNVPAMAQQGQTIYGAYDDRRNSAYLILDNFASIDDLRSTLVHEVLAHGGLHTVIGQAKYQEFVKKLTSTRARAELKDLWARIDKDYKGASESVKAEEVFANFVQNQPERGSLKAWWFELKRWLRRQFEGLGILRKNHARNEMEDMLKAIVRGFDKRKQRMDRASAVLERSGKSPADIRYSKAGSVTDTPAFKNIIYYATHKPVASDLRLQRAMATLGDKEFGLDVNFVSDDFGHWISIEENAWHGSENLGQISNGVAFINGELYEMDPSALFYRDEPPYWSPVVAASTQSLANLYKKLTGKSYPILKADGSDPEEFRKLIQLKSRKGFEYIDGVFQISASNDNLFFSKSGMNPDVRFNMEMEEDTRTAKQKLGLEEQAAESVSEQVKAKYLETASKLKDSKFWNRLKEGIFDGLHGIKQAEEAAGITDPNKMGYVSARLASGLADVLHGVFHYGAPEWRDGIIQRKEGTKGLLEVLGQLPDGELNNWLAWMGANRAKQLKAEGRENNLSQADIDELLALADGKEALFEQVRSEYNAINSSVLDVAQGAGLISAEQRAGFDEQYYVPFFREQDVDPEMQDIHSMVVAPYSKKGIAGQNAKIKELKGGKQSTKDLLENIILRQSTMLDAALKNKAMMEVTDNLTGTDFMTKVDSPEFAKLSQRELNSIQRVKVMRNGQAEAYAVSDGALLRSLIAVNDVGSSSLFNKMGRSFKRFLTTGVTLSPDFIFKNFVRDAAHAWMINKDGFTLGTDSIKGLKDAFAEDEAYRDLIFSGAAFQGGYIHGADPEAAAQQIRRALAKKGLGKSEIDGYMSSLVTNGSQLLEKYREVSDKVENANRLSTFKAGMDAGKSKRQAAFEAKDLMDYSLKGNFALISTMIDFLPFFNARLQGMYKLARGAAAGEGDRVLKVLSANLAMKGMKVAAFSLALAAMNDDDERYQELPDWDKDANWHFWFGDDHIRIPKPFELGIVFGTIPERLLHFGTGTQEGDDTTKAVGNAIFNTLALNPIPQFALPAVEVMVNRSFFKGSPIEGMGDEQRQPGDRYSVHTSDVARELGQLLNISPKKIEHLVNGYTGTLGGYVLGMADIVSRQMMGIEKPETPISRYPVIKAFYGGDAPKSSTYFQQEFYDSLDAAQQAYGSYKRAMEEGDNERAKRLLEDNRDKLSVRLALGRIQRQVSELNRSATQVHNSNLSAAEKREKLDDITRQKNALYQRAYVGLNLSGF